MTLRISSRLSLPREAALWTFGFLAIRGAGKTYDACVLAEELVKIGVPIVALDSLGIWWSLRVGVSGNKGLPVVIFGGPHKDISIPSSVVKGHEIVDEARLKDLVKAMLQTRISVVLDTSDYSKSQQRRIVGVFVEELVRQNAQYGIRFVFIEEADLWVPQRASGETAFVAGAINDLIRRGGNFNVGAALISQRAAVINKDVLTQINCLVALRILAKLDKKAVQTWVEEVAHSDDPRLAKFADSLRDLANGEAWIWHPGDPDIFKRVQFRKRETLHATREYFLQSKLEQANVRPLDVDEFVEKFKDKFEPKKSLPREQTIPQFAQSALNLSKFQENAWHTGNADLRLGDLTVPNKHGPVAQSGSATALQAPESQETKQPEIPGSNPGGSTINISNEEIDVKINTTFRPENFTTDTAEGKFMYVLVTEFPGKSVTYSDHKTAIREHQGWVIDDSTYTNTKKALRERNMIVDDTRNSRVRLPFKVHAIYVDGAKVA